MKAIESAPRQLSLSVRLDDSATFDNFYVGQNQRNIETLEALKSVALEDSANKSISPGINNGNLIYVWGANGAGCSHLLQACCHWFSGQSIYLPAHQIADEDPAEVLAGIEQMPLVILDGLDLVVSRNAWSEQLFHLYNRIHDKRGALVVGAAVPPMAIDTSLADLKSRLSAMQVHKIEALVDDEKISALIFRAANRGMNMPEKVAAYLLTHYSRNMADQIRLLDKLDNASLESQRKLSIPLVKQVIGQTSDK